MPRQKKEIDPEDVKKLAQLQCTNVEIAAFFGIDEKTVRRRFAEVIKEGKENGKVSLRRSQFILAKKSPAMAIWLGKQYLGQVERIEYDIPNAESHFREIARAITQSDTDSEAVLQRRASVHN